MKFKYVGKIPKKDLDLCLHGILDPDEVIMEGLIIEIPDSSKVLIDRIKANGNYEEYIEPKKVSKSKKSKKED